MNILAKRLLIALSSGVVLAFIDIWLSSSSVPDAWDLSGPMFWYMFSSRVLIGFFVALAGVYTVHPVLKVNMYLKRGVIIGALLSIPLAASVFFDEAATWGLFWLIILSGAVYGLIIDFVATKFAGQGRELLHPRNE